MGREGAFDPVPPRPLHHAAPRAHPRMNDLALPDALAARLAAIVGERGLVASAAERATYEVDWRDQWRGRAAAVVKPADTGEASRVVALLAQAGVAMVPQGGNTSLCGA